MWNIIYFLTIVFIILILAVITIIMYNSLIKLRNGVDNAWSQINVQLERRADLVSNLVETVKGYSKHEKSIQPRSSCTAYRICSVHCLPRQRYRH
jgi:LemA protein